eukprot:jgi/Mesvir1/9862/Mv22400-RA.1
MVSVAHLKHVDLKKDMMEPTQKGGSRAPSWSFDASGAVKRAEDPLPMVALARDTDPLQAPFDPPGNANEFQRLWQRPRSTAADQSRVLRSVPMDALRMFKLELPAPLLASLLHVLVTAWGCHTCADAHPACVADGGEDRGECSGDGNNDSGGHGGQSGREASSNEGCVQGAVWEGEKDHHTGDGNSCTFAEKHGLQGSVQEVQGGGVQESSGSGGENGEVRGEPVADALAATFAGLAVGDEALEPAHATVSTRDVLEAAWVLGVLRQLASSGRFSLTVCLLSKPQKAVGAQLFGKLLSVAEARERGGEVAKGAREAEKESTPCADVHENGSGQGDGKAPGDVGTVGKEAVSNGTSLHGSTADHRGGVQPQEGECAVCKGYQREGMGSLVAALTQEQVQAVRKLYKF